MADVTISGLNRQTASNNAVIPISQDGVTYSTPVSSLFTNIGQSQFFNKLTINDSSINSNLILETNYRGTNPGISTSANNKHLYLATNNTNGELRLETNGALRMVVDSAGNIGMGVTSPTENMKMDLYGNLRVAGRILLSNVTPQQGTEYSQIGQVFAEGTIASNSSITLNLNGVSSWPCAGMIAIVMQSQVVRTVGSFTNAKPGAVRLGSFIRGLAFNTNVWTLYNRDTTDVNIGEGFGACTLTNSSPFTYNYSVRVLPVLATIWPVT